MSYANSMQCPKCYSHNTQSVSVAYGQSIRIGETGYRSVSEFGRELEPPQGRSEFGIPLVVAVNVFGLAVLSLPDMLAVTGISWLMGLKISSWLNLVASGAIAILVGVRVASSAFLHNMTKHRTEMRSWRRGVVCRRCGHRFRR